MTDPSGPARPRETDPKPYRPLDPEWASQRPATDWAAKEDLANLVKGLDHEQRARAALRQVEPPEPTEVEAVDIRMTHGELSVLSLGVSETSTRAQREHAREVLWGYAAQAFDAIADEIIHRRPE